MRRGEHSLSGNHSLKLCAAMAATLALFSLAGMSAAQAQTFTVLHNFTGGADGASPYTGLTIDHNGNLYGTTAYGGLEVNDCHITNGCGVIFELAHAGSGFIFRTLYQFQGFPSGDGASPNGRVIIGSDGALYGTAAAGGDTGQDCGVGCGTVFKLTPPATFCKSFSCNWQETILYHFTGGTDGADPLGELAVDGAGNLYGSTFGGGTGGEFGGIVYELTPAQGSWSQTILYNFPRGRPLGGVLRDAAGNLYGTTTLDGEYKDGYAYQLTHAGSLKNLHSFGGPSDGYGTYGVILDQAGNLYGGTSNGVNQGEPIVYELSPSGGSWTYNILYTFPPLDGGGPGSANLVMDAAGSLYGTTLGDGGTGNPYGNVFKLTLSGGVWVYTDLHDFTDRSDGGRPLSNVVIDANGNLYGTASTGGVSDLGVVWEITP